MTCPKLAFLLVLVCPCLAQTSLRVQVNDPSGRGIPGATVTLSRPPAGPTSGKTDIQGQYIFRPLEAGTYSVGIAAKGFAPNETPQYEVVSGRTQALTIALALATTSERITVGDTARLGVDPSGNASTLVLRKAELDALSDDRAELTADLQALAGPAAGPNGGQIFIDGFTGGRLPPKQSIREVRINQNPFAAQFDRPGQGRIEIFTKPGSEEFHGQVLFQFSDASLNSRNTFVDDKPPYRRRQLEGEVSGPINKKTSFLIDFERRDVSENVFINGVVLDSNLNVTPFSQAVVTPATGTEGNFRIDRQLSKNHTLTARYEIARDGNDNQGVGGFSLASRAYKTRAYDDTWQFAETAVPNLHTVNETRFRFRRQRANDSGAVSGATVNVLDSFASGGPPLAVSFNHQNRYELQNFTSHIRGAHTLRGGGLMRGVWLTDQSTQNYPGTFTFTSLEAYRTTLLGIRNGSTAAQIRAAGGGASQFSIAGGDPLASLHQVDFGLFVQDDWRIRPAFTLSTGLRYEAQTHSGDHTNVAPRIGFAWALGKVTAAKAPKAVIRGGFGIFYDRLGENLSLAALRLDGVHQQQFLIPFPDFYPNVPSVSNLGNSAQPRAIRRTDAGWKSPRMYQSAIGIERQLRNGITISSNYLHSRGVHALRSRNINAPFPGIGLGPFGGVNSIYMYESSGSYRQHQLITNMNARISPKLTLSGFYAYGHAMSDTDGAGSFPANQYDLLPEYSRAGFDVRHRVQMNGSVSLPWGFRVNPFVTLASGRPYTITTGRDLNGDSLFNDRPAVATDLSRASVLRTAFGSFDVAPIAGQTIIPRNSVEGPGQATVNMRFSKTFTLGEKSSGGKPAADPKQLTFTANARNAINHPNYGSPNGNLSSTLFGRSTALVGGARRLDLQVRFDF